MAEIGTFARTCRICAGDPSRSMLLSCSAPLLVGLTCASVLTLFVGTLKDVTVASVLFTTFGLAVICTIGAIGAFAAEMLIAGSGLRAEVDAAHRSSQPR
jgi:hypothetical protein